jgi:hypothetical protein
MLFLFRFFFFTLLIFILELTRLRVKTTGVEGRKMEMGSRRDAMHLGMFFLFHFFTPLIFILELTSPTNEDHRGRREEDGYGLEMRCDASRALGMFLYIFILLANFPT